MLQLQDFIAESLRQIMAGTAAAQRHAAEHDGAVCPAKLAYRTSAEGQMFNQQDGTPIFAVEFDVAVTTTEGNEAKGSAGIFVGSFGVGTQGKSDISNESTSRIGFAIPIQLPKQL